MVFPTLLLLFLTAILYIILKTYGRWKLLHLQQQQQQVSKLNQEMFEMSILCSSVNAKLNKKYSSKKCYFMCYFMCTLYLGSPNDNTHTYIYILINTHTHTHINMYVYIYSAASGEVLWMGKCSRMVGRGHFCKFLKNKLLCTIF